MKYLQACRSVDYHSFLKSPFSLTLVLKIIFEGEMHMNSRYEELVECWLTALTRKKEAVHALAFAQHDVESLEHKFSKIIGPEVIQYYRRAYYQDEDTSTALGRYMEVISHVWMGLNPSNGSIPTFSALQTSVV